MPEGHVPVRQGRRRGWGTGSCRRAAAWWTRKGSHSTQVSVLGHPHPLLTVLRPKSRGFLRATPLETTEDRTTASSRLPPRRTCPLPKGGHQVARRWDTCLHGHLAPTSPRCFQAAPARRGSWALLRAPTLMPPPGLRRGRTSTQDRTQPPHSPPSVSVIVGTAGVAGTSHLQVSLRDNSGWTWGTELRAAKSETDHVEAEDRNNPTRNPSQTRRPS